MKKASILILSFVCAFCLAEFVASIVVGYPRYALGARSFFIDADLGSYTRIKWQPPRYGHFSVEGGNRKVVYNNLGLPGDDIQITKRTKPVFLLGDSFIEASQHDGDKIAAGVLQKNLQEALDTNYAVFNLGYSNHDPYLLWYRSSFFEKFYKPEMVVLISVSYRHLKPMGRWPLPLDFSFEDKFGTELPPENGNGPIDIIRSRSSYLSLTARLLAGGANKVQAIPEAAKVKKDLDPQETHRLLLECLARFKSRYGASFHFVSLMSDYPSELDLEQDCRSLGINYHFNPGIMKPYNLIKGGHFNVQGNKALADYLYEIIRDARQ